MQDDKLSKNAVFCMLQDKFGFLWLGTDQGLKRYDGYNTKIYTHIPFDSSSISDNSVLSLYEDKSGVLWIGTLNGGLNRLDRLTDKFYHYTRDEKDINSIDGNTIYSIFQDKKGVLFIGQRFPPEKRMG